MLVGFCVATSGGKRTVVGPLFWSLARLGRICLVLANDITRIYHTHLYREAGDPIRLLGITILGETDMKKLGTTAQYCILVFDTIGWGKEIPKGSRNLAASCQRRRMNIRSSLTASNTQTAFWLNKVCSAPKFASLFSHFVPSHFHTLPRIFLGEDPSLALALSRSLSPSLCPKCCDNM